MPKATARGRLTRPVSVMEKMASSFNKGQRASRRLVSDAGVMSQGESDSEKCRNTQCILGDTLGRTLHHLANMQPEKFFPFFGLDSPLTFTTIEAPKAFQAEASLAKAVMSRLRHLGFENENGGLRSSNDSTEMTRSPAEEKSQCQCEPKKIVPVKRF